MTVRIVPKATAEDDDDVVIALETARVSEERKDTEAAIKWLQRAASAARRQGRPERAGVLSRCAAQLGGTPASFEKAPDEPHVLSEITEDDFAEKTIVETRDAIAKKIEEEPPPNAVPLDAPTPLAPMVTPLKASANQSVRVAVKRILGGRFEARPLAPGEAAGAGEHEALLVPVSEQS